MENIPFSAPKKPEKKEASKQEAGLDYASLFNRFADNFMKLGDKPFMTYEQQNELLELSNDFSKRARLEKDPARIKEFQDKAKEYAEQYIKSRQHKYAAGNYTATFLTAEEFLRETDKISEKEKSELTAELENIGELINEARPTGMTLEIVDKVTNFIEKVQKYTK